MAYAQTIISGGVASRHCLLADIHSLSSSQKAIRKASGGEGGRLHARGMLHHTTIGASHVDLFPVTFPGDGRYEVVLLHDLDEVLRWAIILPFKQGGKRM